MNENATSIDQATPRTLISTTTKPLSSSLSNLSSSSKTIPSNQDFHFYYNFDEFKAPIHKIAVKSQSLLESVGSCSKKFKFPSDSDITEDDNYDWLVNMNDDVLERFDASVDEFKSLRKKQEETGGVLEMGSNENGGESEFQVVYGKKKKGLVNMGSGLVIESGVKVADLKAKAVKAKVPFHVPTIKKPQEAYKILVNNSNQPFEHVWLQRSDDGLRFIHPLESLPIIDFVDTSTANAEPVPPPPLESTPFKLVEEVKDLKQLAATLRGVNEFAVDLEHNQYRSFQGLTCLMQISTRTEDFIIDTLKLRIHVGPYLREVFKDPTKRKVLHGADRDIIWLQRDFGIYICNMFDTGQASRVLKLERNSLEYLLKHYCGVTANKEYQNADWRLRPLTDVMLRYGREDTHYLLYIYDLMRAELLSKPNEPESFDSPLVEVYRRSYDVCMHLYEKELLTESSYLHIYGVQDAGFNAQQLAIVAGLCEWRDVIARTEDESTGFILPNKILIEIAKQMPVTPQKLRRALKTKHPYIERNLGSVVNVIRHAMQNAAEFEAVAQRLKEALLEKKAAQEKIEVNDDVDTNLETADVENETIYDGIEIDDSVNAISSNSELPGESLPMSSNTTDTSASAGINPPAMVTAKATVQILKKPTSAFGALLGNSAGKRRSDIDKKDKEDLKLDKIRTSVNLPFHSFSGINEAAKPAVEEPPVATTPCSEESLAASATRSIEDVIMLHDNSDEEIQENVDSETKDARKDTKLAGSESGTDDDGEPTSLSDLSSSFQKCFPSINRNKSNRNVENSHDPTGLMQLKPFDYAEAKKLVRFGESPAEKSKAEGDEARGTVDRRKSSVIPGGEKDDDGTTPLAQGKRRQAFPASGNRSATFR
ncbi:protein RRP6-like 2 [Mercurialis annua]|uniref:protein RRP6-like 2 n=1 Tax=Mercurialis annua TaxID=3986 RepID=UPI00215ECFD2|nr:protein RRP6-like 2 [Mercurialis annua]